MMMRLLQYDIAIRYQQGKEMFLSDMLSRAYLNNVDETGNGPFEVNVVKHLPISSGRLTEIKDLTLKDEAIQKLKMVINSGWPENKAETHMLVEVYFPYRDELTIHDGIIFRGERVIIPAAMRQKVRELLHAGHRGENATLRRARECMFWPGMSNDIRQTVKACTVCHMYEYSQQTETMIPTEQADRQFQRIGVDLLEWDNKQFHVLVDYHSGYFEVDELPPKATAAVCIKVMKRHFPRYGIPEVCISDNGPQYHSAEFQRC
ncbi:Uncharacterised protein g2262 [Pycnogonum litorale]